MLTWKQSSKDDLSAVGDDGSDYLVTVYHHGTEIIVTGNDPDGNNILYRPVHSVSAGRVLAEKHHADRG